MKRSFLPAIFVLSALLAFSLWNIRYMSAQTQRWRSQLTEVEALAQKEDWPAALSALEASYRDWQSHQTYLHIVSQHDAVDDAEAMYRRAMAFGKTEEVTEFQAEVSDLSDQLRLLSEMEALSLRNIL